MILQSIGWPDRIEDRELFYHSGGSVELEPEAAAFHLRGHAIRFDTYFNLLALRKWKKYTCLEHVTLALEVKGSVEIALLRHDIEGEDDLRPTDKDLPVANALTATVYSQAFQCDDYTAVTLEYPEECLDALALSFEVRPVSPEASIRNIAYHTEADAQPVNLALAICTYKREDFITPNMEMLRRDVFDNPVSPLHGHLRAYITDNGQTLDTERFAGMPVKIYPNQNSGGSGGFSRAAIEAIHDADFAATHVILMDDDISFNVWALERNRSFLSLIKPEYAQNLIGGSLLNASHRHWLYTAGDRVTLEHVTSDYPDWDLRRLKNVLDMTKDIATDFFGWWFCCVPVAVFRERGYSMPFFFQFDDVEFGVRCRPLPRITLNGLCCWHFPHSFNDTDSRYYYCYRNFSITYNFYDPEYTAAYMKAKLKEDVYYSLFTYRFRRAHLMMRGADDFLRGSDWLIAQDPAALHEEIRAASDPMVPAEKVSVPFDPKDVLLCKDINQNRIRRYLRWITLNGWLMPAKRRVVVVENFRPPMQYFFRAGTVVMYDVDTHLATVSRRSYREAFSVLRHLRKTLKAIDRDFDKAADDFRACREELCSEAFWRKFLNF